MTGVVLLEQQSTNKMIDSVTQLRNDPKVMEMIEEGMQARLEGRVQSWNKVKEELGI